ncbi:glycosyltransferase [Methylobacterium planeticum]|uniref:Glycosyltransferase family 4 protein n=1 Tax=Methylobacterium planeticum TaxID=2615211 RepID=A0A6N6MKY9_9HYPH|nr:glycosyltransferase [Methylobacterium planeticum]KAB1069577.1 glycosyltransferase family 4 protein [Methylobacterium planeticum]
MRVAIIHYWLVGMRGGEKVVEALCRLYPDADIFTHVYVPDAVSATIRRHRVTATFIDRLPRAASWYKRYLPLMPMALEQLDLRDYDLVISSESGPAKGVIPAPGAAHICYCHSPMRYLWNMSHDYRDKAGPVTRALMPVLSHYLRMWDVSTAARVDDFVANSHTVADRIQSYYHRDATVIAPPVDTEAFAPVAGNELSDHHLMVGELVAYKRPDLAVEAFNRSGRRLVVIGGGEMLGRLRAMAAPNVSVLGPQPFGVLKHHYARCRGLIFPGEEDFGIVPVEAMASGRPVIAYARGGATETVVPGLSGILFETQSVEALAEAVAEAERTPFETARLVAHARRFGLDRFAQAMGEHVAGLVGAHAGRRIAALGRLPLREGAARRPHPAGFAPVPRHAAE